MPFSHPTLTSAFINLIYDSPWLAQNKAKDLNQEA